MDFQELYTRWSAANYDDSFADFIARFASYHSSFIQDGIDPLYPNEQDAADLEDGLFSVDELRFVMTTYQQYR